MVRNTVEAYLSELFQIRSSGAAVPETSYYPALSKLLNDVGGQLSPRVVCITQLANLGAGSPDGGLFTLDQIQRGPSPIPGQLPARGAIEVKPTTDDAWLTAEGVQVFKYWNRYRLVLVTNYRDFLLLGQDETGQPRKLESFSLADSDVAFWAAAATPRKTAKEIGERFVAYLKRIMLHSAKIVDPQQVAWFLASYARESKARIEGKSLPSLEDLRTALQNSLGLEFVGEKADNFFRSTLVQTLFYGIFSAWILWHREHSLKITNDRFDWKKAAWLLHVPMVSRKWSCRTPRWGLWTTLRWARTLVP